ncbi:MAG TPA: hypothetical protein VMS21_03520, partial [Methylomirabilota bacterium]|nr:hypothetical protein [Methylomirabilota bacterium]
MHRPPSPPACLLAAALLSLPGANAEPLTPHHVARIQHVSTARISPDGNHIAYLLSVPRQPGVDEDG